MEDLMVISIHELYAKYACSLRIFLLMVILFIAFANLDFLWYDGPTIEKYARDHCGADGYGEYNDAYNRYNGFNCANYGSQIRIECFGESFDNAPAWMHKDNKGCIYNAEDLKDFYVDGWDNKPDNTQELHEFVSRAMIIPH